MTIILEAHDWGGRSGVRLRSGPGRRLGEEIRGSRAGWSLLVCPDRLVVAKGFDDMQGFADSVQAFLERSFVKGLSDGLGDHPLNADDKNQEEQELNDLIHLNEEQ